MIEELDGILYLVAKYMGNNILCWDGFGILEWGRDGRRLKIRCGDSCGCLSCWIVLVLSLSSMIVFFVVDDGLFVVTAKHEGVG